MSHRKVSAAVVVIHNFNQKNKRSKWCKEWLKKRDNFSYVNLLNELRVSAQEDLKNFLRMDETHFNFLLSKVKSIITKADTVMRKSISAEERLIVTLRFLATGRSFEDLKFSCAISPQSLRIIIPETCQAIYKRLRREYI